MGGSRFWDADWRLFRFKISSKWIHKRCFSFRLRHFEFCTIGCGVCPHWFYSAIGDCAFTPKIACLSIGNIVVCTDDKRDGIFRLKDKQLCCNLYHQVPCLSPQRFYECVVDDPSAYGPGTKHCCNLYYDCPCISRRRCQRNSNHEYDHESPDENPTFACCGILRCYHGILGCCQCLHFLFPCGQCLFPCCQLPCCGKCKCALGQNTACSVSIGNMHCCTDDPMDYGDNEKHCCNLYYHLPCISPARLHDCVRPQTMER